MKQDSKIFITILNLLELAGIPKYNRFKPEAYGYNVVFDIPFENNIIDMLLITAQSENIDTFTKSLKDNGIDLPFTQRYKRVNGLTQIEFNFE